MNSSKNRGGSLLITFLIIAAVLYVVGTLLFPAVSCGPIPAWKTQAKNDATLIATALNAYFEEYGKFPSVQAGNANSANLMNTLASTLANDPENPKKIVFLEIPKAKNHRNGAEMADHGTFFTSAYKDGWGNDYEIRLDSTITAYGQPTVEGPDGPVNKRVIIWSRGDPARARDFADAAKWIKSWE